MNDLAHVARAERGGDRRRARAARAAAAPRRRRCRAPLQSCCTMLAKLVAALISRVEISAYCSVLSALYCSERMKPQHEKRREDDARPASPRRRRRRPAIASRADDAVIDQHAGGSRSGAAPPAPPRSSRCCRCASAKMRSPATNAVMPSPTWRKTGRRNGIEPGADAEEQPAPDADREGRQAEEREIDQRMGMAPRVQDGERADRQPAASSAANAEALAPSEPCAARSRL